MMLVADTDLVAIAEDLWASYLGSEPAPTVPGLVRPDLSATVSISGGWCGAVVVATSARGARLVGASLLELAEDQLSDADIADALGELVNIVGGNVKSALPGPSALSLPVVSHGAVTTDRSRLVTETALEWRGENFEITVWASPEEQER